MCGIVGYTGGHEASPILLAGLRRLEYRGYDSAGLATLDGRRIALRKRAGRVAALEEALDDEPAPGTCGISHTRWATHGPATDANAHPHVGGEGARPSRSSTTASSRTTPRSAGARGRRRRLPEPDGYRGRRPPRRPRAGRRRATCSRPSSGPCRGSRGRTAWPSSARGVRARSSGRRLGSPLVVGLGEGEHLLASDPSAIAPHTARVAFLQDGEVVRLTPDDFEIVHRERGSITPRIDRIDWSPDRDELGGHAHYMLKEIREQPEHRPRHLPRPAPPRRGHGAVRRAQPHGPPAPPGPPRRPRRLRHELARGAGGRIPDRATGESARRGRIRGRVPLPERPARRPDARIRPQPVGRDGRHLGGIPRVEAAGASDAGDLQRRRLDHRPRGRRRHLSPRRPRDRRRQHQGVLGAGGRADDAGPAARAAPVPLVHGRPGGRRGAGRGARGDRPRAGDRAGDHRGGRAAAPRRGA